MINKIFAVGVTILCLMFLAFICYCWWRTRGDMELMQMVMAKRIYEVDLRHRRDARILAARIYAVDVAAGRAFRAHKHKKEVR